MSVVRKNSVRAGKMMEMLSLISSGFFSADCRKSWCNVRPDLHIDLGLCVEVGSRQILHYNVTEHPTAGWTLQQFREALPSAEILRSDGAAHAGRVRAAAIDAGTAPSAA